MEASPGAVMIYNSGELHRNLNTLHPSKNINIEIDDVFFANNSLEPSSFQTLSPENPELRLSALKAYRECHVDDANDDVCRGGVRGSHTGADPGPEGKRRRRQRGRPGVGSMFLPKHVKLLEFKSRGGQVTTAETVSWIQQKRYANPLFIIINKKTGSAAEALTFALQAKKRATVVGQPSAGAANMNSWYVVNSDVYVSVSTGAPTLPGTETSWERKGVQPDHTVAEGNEIEAVLRLIGQREVIK